MDRLRILSLLVVCAVAGCRENRVSQAEGELLVQPLSVDFGRGYVSSRHTAKLQLQNTAQMGIEVTLEVGAPFDAPGPVQLGGGEQVELELGVTSTQLGALEGTLLVSANGFTQRVPLRAEAVETPACPARDCFEATFNPLTGECEELVAVDGASCGVGNQCLSGGVCAAGICVGRPRDCNDDNACTTDACDATTGCVHDVVTCPLSLRPCEVGVCSPATGCGFEAATDGQLCGANDCNTAQVCISGQCVACPSPEGSQCKPATSCRGPGICQQQACTLPPPVELQPSWRHSPDAGVTLAFLGSVDDDGNLYITETGIPQSNAQGAPDTEQDRVSGVPFVPASNPVRLLSLSPTGAVRFRVEVTTECPSCVYGLSYSIDSANHRLFFNAKGSTQARSTDDGHLLWTTVPTNGLPAYDLRSDGGAAFSTSPPMLIGTDGLGVPVLEGSQDHHAYVQVFDRATGAFRWQFHRKGHLYGTGIAPGGELWTSSANCWAVAGEMARVNGAGQQQGAQFVQWIPSIYGAGVAIGTANGKLHKLDAALTLTDLTSITTAGPSSVPLISGQQLVLWDGAARALRSVNLMSGAQAFAVQGITGQPDFELIRDGGVAWTAQFPDAGMLGAVNGNGDELLSCPLPSTVDSPTAISHGRAAMISEGHIVSYPVPGLEVESSGWVSRSGSLQRGSAAR